MSGIEAWPGPGPEESWWRECSPTMRRLYIKAHAWGKRVEERYAPLLVESDALAELLEVSRTEGRVRATFELKHRRGIHARPAGLIYARLSRYAPAALVSFGLNSEPPAVEPVRGLSAWRFVRGLSGRLGDTLEVVAEGDDAEAVLEIFRGILEVPTSTLETAVREIEETMSEVREEQVT